jgi:hypothetical protein
MLTEERRAWLRRAVAELVTAHAVMDDLDPLLPGLSRALVDVETREIDVAIPPLFP